MQMTPTRRDLLAALGALMGTSLFSNFPARASDAPVELEWSDLIPGGSGEEVTRLLDGIGIVEHGGRIETVRGRCHTFWNCDGRCRRR